MQVTSSISLATSRSRPDRNARSLARLLNPMPDFELARPYSPNRSELEGYVAAQFARIHGAELTEFMPWLIGMKCAGKLSVAIGLRPGGHDRLFVEQYFDLPAEAALADRLGIEVSRNRLVEIGNLSATHRGATQLFFVMLTGLLEQAACDWAVITATAQVQRILNKMGIPYLEYGPADPARLGKAADRWGRYYQSRPNVLALSVAGAADRVRHSLLTRTALELLSAPIASIGRELQFPTRG